MTSVDRFPRFVRRMGRMVSKPLRRGVRDATTPPGLWELTRVTPPPACPPGMEIAPPDFIGVGVQRSGTTWWWRLMLEHPSVFSRPDQVKEISYLVGNFLWDPPGPDAALGYARWFPRPPGMLTGEWTARYLPHPWLGAALSALAPKAKVLVSLRDPIERFISGMTHSVMRVGRLRPGHETFELYLSGYARQLRMLDSRVPREQILVLQFERNVLEPGAQLARTFEFLGLDAHVPHNLSTPYNKLERKLELSVARRELLRDALAPDVDELVRRYPEIDRNLWPNFA